MKFGTFAALVILIILLYQCGEASKNANQPAAAAAPANNPANCQKVIDGAQETGLVKEKPSLNRLNVDDLMWAALPAGEKTALAEMLFCTTYDGKSFAQGAAMDYVVIYGYRSGKKLAMLSSVGMDFE